MNLLSLFLRHQRGAGLLIATIFLLLLALGWLVWPDAFFRAYWFALMFWTQLSIGALIALLIYYLTGGKWGREAAPILRATASGFFLLLPLFLPALVALPHIFSWTMIRAGISAPVLVNKQPWLNAPAFIVRTLIYLAALALFIRAQRGKRLRAMAGPALVAVLLLISFCSADWMMSLQPTFYSSLYPFLYFSGAMVSIFSLLTGLMAWLQLKGALPSRPELLLDYGKLLLTAVLFWGYIVFAQFIIIWTGNLPDEAEWYVVRSEPAWLWLTVLVVIGHFAVPFCLLLSQKLKKDAQTLLVLCATLFALHVLEVFWMMRPTPDEGFRAGIFDLFLPLVMGAGWLWFVLGGWGSLPSLHPEVSDEI